MAMGCLGFAAAICGGDLIIKDYVKENVLELQPEKSGRKQSDSDKIF